MSTVAIIQAHMGSSRLPGKVLLDLAGKPVLLRVVERVQHIQLVENLIVAISNLPGDDILAKKCEMWGIPVYRGDDRDVLSRFRGAAESANADVCVRITSDCPLLDPGVSNMIINTFLSEDPSVDYASNKIPQSFPRGLDTEVFTIDALRRADELARRMCDRTHVTLFMYENPDKFRLRSVISNVNRAHWRWTLDTQEDYEFLCEVYARLPCGDPIVWEKVVQLLEREPSLMEINAHVHQKEVQEG